ncbi:hypothetical protein [Brevundimonas poindexterae]|uniref:hypothetical protein n=1 Tax=Brevundimonas poindexterae TaxID=74325 RepID=UPI001CFD1DDA|nr:hypothetical protein [Brevundimonas poindexterae]
MNHHDPNHTDQGYWPRDWPGHDPDYDPDRAAIDDECAGIFTEREPRARSGYHRVSDDTWARARADYLAGESAPVVCDRYGMRLSTLRNRAAAEGWRRQDQPEPDPVDLELEREQGLPDPADMAAHALIRLNRAILRGHATEAGRWMRLHVRLLELARRPAPRPAKPAPDPVAEAIEADLAALEAKLRQLDQLQGEAAGGADAAILPPRGRGTAVRSAGVVGAVPPFGVDAAEVSPLPHPSDGPPPPMGEDLPAPLSDHSDHSDGIFRPDS